LMDVAEAQQQMTPEGQSPAIRDLPAMLERLSRHFLREDVEIFPSNFGQPMVWNPHQYAVWGAAAVRIYPEMGRLGGVAHATVEQGLRRCVEKIDMPLEKWAADGRLGTHLI